MALVSGLLANCSGLIHFHPKLPFKIERHNSTRYDDYKAFQPPARLIHRARFQYSCPEHLGTRYVTLVGRNHHHQLSFHDDLPEEPFWLSLIKEASWGLKSLFVFLVEQPSQLKYIEWPGFQSTIFGNAIVFQILKTATLTLVIVAVLIVALTSVDSALCYMLALILRRTP